VEAFEDVTRECSRSIDTAGFQRLRGGAGSMSRTYTWATENAPAVESEG
jgi:hypothetical protein